ncbi:MAG: hypothetical protein M1481_06985 [Candidatus Thermoplasmatota archaeon]|nr:hypothetical protein [Candidatus Thermoplasmatota archaeon]
MVVVKDHNRAKKIGWIAIVIAVILFVTGSYLTIVSKSQSNVANIPVTNYNPQLNTTNVSPRAMYSGVGISLIIIGSIPLIIGVSIIIYLHRKVPPLQYYKQ